MKMLVVNAGSSSLKLSVLDDDDSVVAAQDLAHWDGDDAGIGRLAAAAGGVDVVGHRVVHGGLTFTGPVVVDDDVVGQLTDLVPLAPLHQPRAIAAIGAARRALPAAAHVACFDTAFHATIPAAAHTYPLPAEWRTRWPVLRRFGFHGLSHAYASRRTAELLDRPITELQIVTCHLGAGASLCAVRNGESVDTTMGFTPLEGLVMATRAGSVDPGLVLWLLQNGGLGVDEVLAGLERHSGLVALAGTDDMQVVVERRAAGETEALFAFDVYTHRLRREIGAMRAALDQLDACVFTGGVGEHASRVRAASGLALDPDANAAMTGDGDADGEISASGAAVRTFVVTAREDLEMSRQIRALL